MVAHRNHVIDRDSYSDEDAVGALKAYGYREVSPGMFIRHIGAQGSPDLTTERWVQVPGGFECYKTDRSWGRDARPEDANGQRVGEPYYQIPIAPLAQYSQVSGVAPSTHPEAFEWVWPAGAVAFQYLFAESGWRRDVGEDGVERMIWEGTDEES